MAELEAGEATALVDNRSRALDPGNTASPWAPNVKPRRRIRFVLQPRGVPERTIWTGFIDRLPIGWEVGDGWVELTAVDLLGLIAGDTVPPSVLHHTIKTSGPVAYWPMTEESGSTVDDVVGNRDGAWRLTEQTSTQPLVPYDPRSAQVFGLPSKASLVIQAASVRDFRSPSTMTVAAWVRMVRRSTDAVIRMEPAVQFDTTDPNTFAYLGVTRQTPTGPGIVAAGVFAGANSAWIEAAGVYPDLYDGAPHLIVMATDPSTATGFVAVDDRAPVAFAHVTATYPTLAGTWGPLWFGDRLSPSAYPEGALNDDPQEWLIGHVAIWNRTLTAAEIASLYAAGTNPWEGDLTSERLARLLDVAGIAAGDRDIAPGTVRCEAARFDGGNLLDELRKVVATEPGGALYVDPEGRIAFRPGPPNNPAPVATFVGNPRVDPGTPYTDVTPSYSLDRVVNVAEVTRANGVTQRIENATSVTAYGPLGVQIDTLHRDASGARGAGARLVNRFRDPATVLEALSVNGRSDDVTPADLLDRDISSPVRVIARPTGGGAPIEQLALVEAVGHELDWRSRTWQTDYGLAEHVVLPLFWWGTAGQGWDESVWSDT